LARPGQANNKVITRVAAQQGNNNKVTKPNPPTPQDGMCLLHRKPSPPGPRNRHPESKCLNPKVPCTAAPQSPPRRRRRSSLGVPTNKSKTGNKLPNECSAHALGPICAFPPQKKGPAVRHKVTLTEGPAPQELRVSHFLQRDSITEKPAPSLRPGLVVLHKSLKATRRPPFFQPFTISKPHAFLPLSSVLIPPSFVFLSLYHVFSVSQSGTVLYRAASHRPLHAQDPYPVYLILNRRAPLGARRPFSAARRYHGGLPTPPRLTKKQAGDPQLTVSARAAHLRRAYSAQLARIGLRQCNLIQGRRARRPERTNTTTIWPVLVRRGTTFI
jgi:hypothetical protein